MLLLFFLLGTFKYYNFLVIFNFILTLVTYLAIKLELFS